MDSVRAAETAAVLEHALDLPVPLETVLLFGWQPWALCRVAAFVVLGVVLAEPLLARLKGYPYRGLSSARRYLAWAAAGIAADWILKAALAPAWREALAAAMP